MKLGEITNKYGQTATECLDFCHCGEQGNCQLHDDWQETIHPCIIYKNKFCEHYNIGGN